MGSTFPTFANVIASSTADVSSLATYLALPIIALVFTVTVVIVGVALFRKYAVKGVRGAAGMGGGRRGRGRRR